jgi:hypothetical protein
MILARLDAIIGSMSLENYLSRREADVLNKEDFLFRSVY